MKILHIINNLGSGGAEKLLSDMLPIMINKADIKIDVLILTDKDNVFNKNLEENNINIIIVSLKNIYNPLNIYYIRKYIKEGKYDIVHAHIFPTIYWTSIASKIILKNKPKFIITEHSTNNKRRNKKMFYYIEKFIYKEYDKIISVSDMTQKNLLNWIKPSKPNKNKFIVIENGIDLEKYENAIPYKKNELNEEFNNDTKLITMVGRFADSKDQNTIIRAMSNLNENINLLLVGDGKLKEKSIELTKSIGLENRVHFLGFRSDVDRIIKSSDIVILSSNWEGFGLSAVEGMACENPVIATNVCGLKEVVEGAGILFERGNDEQLSEIISKLITDKDYYNLVSKSCKNRSEDFNITKTISRYINIYVEVSRGNIYE
ncbi:glycosyltransferase [[Clostridium] dakarense]|uniref:glycosyltransferase n=1 Tax=Faecalimicrobium dakarense TaxID=1301100 RepID=UPI0004AD0E8A|nr:glycosyltransferase [[Clostridium] dakarense]